MQIEREPAGDVMRDDGFMDVHRALRPSGRAAGEVQQGHVFGTRPYRFERIRRLRQGRGQIDRACGKAARTFGQEDVLQAREFFSPRLDLAPIECFGGDEHLGLADRHTGLDRLRTECREQWREDAAVLQRAERGDVELGHAAEKREYPIAFRNPALRQDIGKSVRLRA